MNRVLFLDIDGPMIPATMYMIDEDAGRNRTVSPLSVACVKHLVEKTGAKIVINSYHNKERDGVASIKDRLIEAGLPAIHFHEDGRTIYPEMRERDVAVKEWLARHPETTEWLAIDDTRFLEENLILVSSDAGITLNDMNMALMHFNCETVMVFV